MIRSLAFAAAAGILLLSAPLPAMSEVDRTNGAPAQAANPALDDRLDLDSHEMPLGGALRQPELWSAYKARFVTEAGRVVDTGNGGVSHSEGQGYGMLFAVAANDRVAFDRIWGWTRANLMVRDDQLLAWRWEPNARPAVADINDAADGDILVAWALTEAAEFWNDSSYRIAGRRIAVEVGRKLLVFGGKDGPVLLPAVAGFAKEDRPDGPVLNLSYWVFPAFERLPKVAPEVDWSGLINSGLTLLKTARFGSSALPADWYSARDGAAAPASGFARAFSYNAIRIPLYMAMAGLGDRAHYAPFVALWSKGQGVGAVDLDNGAQGRPFEEGGYRRIADLTLCAAQKTPLPADFFAPRPNENYYPATLQVLAVIAAQSRYGSCSN
jgi:endo-1,4-beta-D-glucanase Y